MRSPVRNSCSNARPARTSGCARCASIAGAGSPPCKMKWTPAVRPVRQLSIGPARPVSVFAAPGGDRDQVDRDASTGAIRRAGASPDWPGRGLCGAVWRASPALRLELGFTRAGLGSSPGFFALGRGRGRLRPEGLKTDVDRLLDLALSLARSSAIRSAGCGSRSEPSTRRPRARRSCEGFDVESVPERCSSRIRAAPCGPGPPCIGVVDPMLRGFIEMSLAWSSHA